MSDVGLIEDPAARRKLRPSRTAAVPALDDLAATQTHAQRRPQLDHRRHHRLDHAPTRSRSRRASTCRSASQNGRRIARFVSDAPIKNYFSIQSGRYAVRSAASRRRRTCRLPPPRASLERRSHDDARCGPRSTITAAPSAPISSTRRGSSSARVPRRRAGLRQHHRRSARGIFAMDLRDPEALDMVTMLTAHELAHQWWGHQVHRRADAGRRSLLYETLAQYSALMVMKRIQGEDGIRRFLQFQLDRYLSGRRTEVLGGAAARQRRARPGSHQLRQGRARPLSAAAADGRGCGQSRAAALRRPLPLHRRALSALARPDRSAAGGGEDAGATGADHRPVRADHRSTICKVGEPKAVKRADGRWDVTVPVEARQVSMPTARARRAKRALDRADRDRAVHRRAGRRRRSPRET